MEGTDGVNKALKTAKKASSSLRSTDTPDRTRGGRPDDETRRRYPGIRRLGDNRVRQPNVSARHTLGDGDKPTEHSKTTKNEQNTVAHECVSHCINLPLRLFHGSSPFCG